MRATHLRPAPLAATILAAVIMAALVLIPHPALAVTVTSADLSSVFGSGTTNTFFQWQNLLGFVFYVLVPLVAVVGVIVLINRVRDNPEPGNIVFTIGGIILIMGVAIAVFALPGKLNASTTGGTTGALIASSATLR